MEKLEVEAKFLLPGLKGLELGTGKHIVQEYLDFGDPAVKELIQKIFGTLSFDIHEVRIRNQAGQLRLTVKSRGDLQRTEAETTIDKNTFEKYRTHSNKGEIFKIRYALKLGHKLVYEIDKYLENLSGLCTGEVEYDPQEFTEENIIKMVMEVTPEAINVTRDSAFKNQSLAQMKNLTELETKFNHGLHDLNTAVRISKILTGNNAL